MDARDELSKLNEFHPEEFMTLDKLLEHIDGLTKLIPTAVSEAEVNRIIDNVRTALEIYAQRKHLLMTHEEMEKMLEGEKKLRTKF
jgi:hypothetical protein